MSERRNLARNPGNRIYLGTPTSRYYTNYHIIIFIHILMICPYLPPFTGILQIRTSVTSKLTESQRHMWSYVFQSYVKLLKICLELLLLRTPRTPLFHLVSCESDVSCVLASATVYEFELIGFAWRLTAPFSCPAATFTTWQWQQWHGIALMKKMK